jgi:hypothetical protein
MPGGTALPFKSYSKVSRSALLGKMIPAGALSGHSVHVTGGAGT